jgi:glutaredoxin-related protein
MEIKIFSMKGCPHCDNLKNQLIENKIVFTEVDILPAVVIGKTAFLPDRSFNTIDEAVKQIKTHLQVL